MNTGKLFILSVLLITVVIGLVIITTPNMDLPAMAVNLVWSG